MALSIHISLAETQAQLGHPIALRVEFKNEGAVARTFREPARTWELALLVFGPEGPRASAPAPFGKIFLTNYDGKERRTVEDAAEISLGPGETHTFVEDVGTRWPHLFVPGMRQLQVIDRSDAGARESNIVSVQVLFAEASMPKLFELAERSTENRDPARQSSEDGLVVTTRQFAANWIARIQPGFQLDAAAFDPAAEARNRAAVAQARALWARQEGTPEMLAKVKEINRSGSLPPPTPDGSN
jgi:hypothetical protein